MTKYNFKNNFQIKNYTTYKIGGNAKFFSECYNFEDLYNITIKSKKDGLPLLVIGNGSNILISDNGFPGLVIKLKGDFNKVIFNENTVQAGAGVLLPSLSRHCLTNNWDGFEFMCGIPGTIGGAVRINAGNKQGEIKDVFISTTVLTPTGDIETITKNNMQFSYRYSKLLKSKSIILLSTFKKSKITERSIIKDKIKKIIISRREKQPRIKQNCGSVFKSPLGSKSAGWYIEQAGLKGFRIGDAMVAYEHANWILNLGNASAQEVKDVITHIQEIVSQRFGILLEREVIYVPEDVL